MRRRFSAAVSTSGSVDYLIDPPALFLRFGPPLIEDNPIAWLDERQVVFRQVHQNPAFGSANDRANPYAPAFGKPALHQHLMVDAVKKTMR